MDRSSTTSRRDILTSLANVDSFKIEALFPNFYDETWVSYTLKSVLEGVQSDKINIGATVLAKAQNVTASYVHPLVNRHLQKFIFPRLLDPVRSVYRSAARRLGPADVAYFWLRNPAKLSEQLRRRGVMVVREMINCTLELRREELRKAYAALGEADRSGISNDMVEQERCDLLAADAVFCPNPYVKQSVLRYGVPEEKCIESSYGWSSDRMGSTSRALSSESIFTVAFVGTIDVRKGVPVLLEAWIRSGVRGRLILAGVVHPEIKARYAEVLKRKDIVNLGYVQDVGSVYRSADVFCFPTWEEGGPQVTLEAMSAGAVPVVTPMGTAGAFEENQDFGIVIPPGDIDALSGALCELADDTERLAFLKSRCKARAREYTWELVGARRRARLVARRKEWLGSE